MGNRSTFFSVNIVVYFDVSRVCSVTCNRKQFSTNGIEASHFSPCREEGPFDFTDNITFTSKFFHDHRV